jgi:hypothetical protein
MSDTLPFWGPQTGTLSAAGNTLTLNCPGSTTANISVNGTWTGDITVYGSTDAPGVVQGFRIAYKAGIGSSGISTITGNGLLVQKEFPVLTGGQRITVQAQPNFVGSVALTVIATASPSIIGISGPVHTAEEEAIRNAHGFTFTTGIQTISAGNFLNVIIKNPSNSGVNLFFRRRYFYTDRVGSDAPMVFAQLANPVDPGLSFVQGSNLQTGPIAVPTPMSGCTFGFNVSGTHIDTSPPTPTPIQAIIDDSQPFIIDTERMILPGASLGYYIPGVGTSGNASQVEFLCNWYEEVTP